MDGLKSSKVSQQLKRRMWIGKIKHQEKEPELILACKVKTLVIDESEFVGKGKGRGWPGIICNLSSSAALYTCIPQPPSLSCV